MKYVKSLGFQTDPNYIYLIDLFNEILDKLCNIDPLEKYVYDWDEKYKSTFVSDGSPHNNQKNIHTSIAIGVSKLSPMLYKDDSNLAQMKNDIIEHGIFQKNNV
jgi:hypothetical protein